MTPINWADSALSVTNWASKALAAQQVVTYRFTSRCDELHGCGKVYPGDLDKCPHCGTSCAFSSTGPADTKWWGWDVETFPNCFTATFVHAATGDVRVFEISDRRNDLDALVRFVMHLRGQGCVGVGFNNIGFDYEVLHSVICRRMGDVARIYEIAMSLIKSNDKFGNRTWPSDHYFKQLDLFKIWHFDNVNKFTSLKALEIAMCSKNVRDLPFPVGTVLTHEQKDVLLDYNLHDVRETLKFAARSLQQIELRASLSGRYNVDMTNFSNTKIGGTILVQQMEAAGIVCYDRNPGGGGKVPRQSPRPLIRLADVVFPCVRFERPEFQAVLDFFNSKTITETKGVFNGLSAIVDGFEFVFGVGGIHGSVASQIVYSDDEYQIEDVDVTSFYPKIAIVNNMYPAHLGPQYCTTYNQIFDQRSTFAKGTPENAALKEALNASYGNSNNQYSPLYDPFYTMQTTINGQLLLCMLAEQLMKIPGLSMIQANTDGITYRCPRVHLGQASNVCRWWESLTGLELETSRYSRMMIRDVNNYIAEYEGGKLKRKGAYEYETQWHQDPSAKVVAMAAEAALVRGECLASFIVTHTNAFDFMIRAKVPRSSRLVLRYETHEEELQGTTRVYSCMSGGALFKVMPPSGEPGTWKRKAKVPDREYARVMAEIATWTGEKDSAGTPWDERIHTGNRSKHEVREMGICSGYRVRDCADADDFDWGDLDYGYYVTEALKLVAPLQN